MNANRLFSSIISALVLLAVGVILYAKLAVDLASFVFALIPILLLAIVVLAVIWGNSKFRGLMILSAIFIPTILNFLVPHLPLYSRYNPFLSLTVANTIILGFLSFLLLKHSVNIKRTIIYMLFYIIVAFSSVGFLVGYGFYLLGINGGYQ